MAKPPPGPFVGAPTAGTATDTLNQEKAGHVSNGLIGTIIGVLVIVVLVIVILQLT